MDRNYHFQEKQMGSVKEIEAYTFQMATNPLDSNFPLWRFEVLRNSTGDDVLVLKIHHCLTDGLGMLFAFLPMLSCKSGAMLDKIPLPKALKDAMVGKGEVPVRRQELSYEDQKLGCCRRRCRDTSAFWKG